ncbi:MAG: 3',5'-cyclic-nucleotide phosphodiesterase [Planctomycetes bacterium]|nr:3',5'-cyclic-nucleotide phosphodiesterase [Planctomycetota bacterium]
MLRLLHISDLHFGPPYLDRVGEALLRLAPELRPDVVVVSGDLTQRARREQFEAARSFLDRLPPVPRVVVPGNHDVPLYRVAERVMNPLGLYREYISHEINAIARVDGAVFVALDSTCPRQAISNGRIFRSQLEFCARAFEGAPPDAARIVVAHHHFAPAPDFERNQVMPKAKRAMNAFVELGVDMILGGHLHRAYIGNSLDIYPGNHRDRGIIIVQCGTTTSRRGRAREREKNSFNMIMVGNQVVHISHYMYFEEGDGFQPVSRHFFPRPGRLCLEQPEEPR